MNGLKELKELIVGCVSNYIGKEKHDMSISGNEGMYAGGGLLGQATPHNTLLGNAAQQATQNSYIQRAQLQMQMAQQQAAMNNAYATQHVPAPNTLAAFNLGANSVYTFEDLNDEGSVYNMPLQTAVDLAINVFGSGWFKDYDTAKALEENTDFLIKVMSKLYKAGRLKCETCRDFNLDQAITAWKILDTDHGNS